MHLWLKYIVFLFAPSATTASATQRCKCRCKRRIMHLSAIHGMMSLIGHKRDTGLMFTTRYGNQVDMATTRNGHQVEAPAPLASAHGNQAWQVDSRHHRWLPTSRSTPEMVSRQTSASHQTGAPHLVPAAMPRVPQIQGAREQRSTRAKKDRTKESGKSQEPRR